MNQIENLKLNDTSTKMVTFSAGNYGKSFAYVCNKRNLNAKVILPSAASDSKYNYILSQGLEAERVDHTKLLYTVEENVKNGYKLVHPIDDANLMSGYSS